MCGLEQHPEVSAFSPQVFLSSHFPLVGRMLLLNILVSAQAQGWFGLLRVCLMGAMACSQ